MANLWQTKNPHNVKAKIIAKIDDLPFGDILKKVQQNESLRKLGQDVFKTSKTKNIEEIFTFTQNLIQ